MCCFKLCIEDGGYRGVYYSGRGVLNLVRFVFSSFSEFLLGFVGGLERVFVACLFIFFLDGVRRWRGRNGFFILDGEVVGIWIEVDV